MNASPASAGEAAPPPAARVLEAPSGWRAIDFVSDLHLAPGLPRTFDAWSQHMASTDADAVFILGDLFEVWIGDDSRRDDFEVRCADVLARAARRLAFVGFMAGNRDFLVGADLLGETGVVALPDPTLLVAFGRRVLLSHGDALCLADVPYQRWRAQVRDPRWQQAVLARPLAERRLMARQLRDGSEAHQQQAGRAVESAMDPAEIDIDPAETSRWLDAADADTLVHGHIHRPQTGEVAAGVVRHVLSDWDLDCDPARPRAEVLRLGAAGFARLSPQRETGPAGR